MYNIHALRRSLEDVLVGEKWGLITENGIDLNLLHVEDKPDFKLTETQLEQINLKHDSYITEIAFEKLRDKRDNLLLKCDWVIAKSVETGIEISDVWKSYRQALRDLPATAQPQLDENGNLINVNWPEKPE